MRPAASAMLISPLQPPADHSVPRPRPYLTRHWPWRVLLFSHSFAPPSPASPPLRPLLATAAGEGAPKRLARLLVCLVCPPTSPTLSGRRMPASTNVSLPRIGRAMLVMEMPLGRRLKGCLLQSLMIGHSSCVPLAWQASRSGNIAPSHVVAFTLPGKIATWDLGS
ncbi:hypothetical protein CFE70_002617 [Pyrenophora teres f. teres 0-1]